MSIKGTEYLKVLDPGERSALKERLVWTCDMELLPLVVAQNAATGSPGNGQHQSIELSHQVAQAATIDHDPKGWVMANGAATQYAVGTLQPCCGASATLYKTIFDTGHGTTRTSCVVADTFATGAATETDSGHGIIFSAAIRTYTSIADMAMMIGLVNTTAGTYLGAPGGIGAASEATASYTGPDDGAYFYLNTASDNYFKVVTNYGSTDQVQKTQTPIAASTRYLLEIALDKGRVPSYYINGTRVGEGHALDASTSLFPIVSFKTMAAAAKTLYFQGMRIQKSW